MFDLVADVARYPEFLPWISAVRVRDNGAKTMVADVVVGFKGLSERFTSRVEKMRPGRIHVDYVDGPLERLTNDWTFRDDGSGGTEIDFAVDFAFRSRLFQMIAGQVFDKALRRMIGAFEARAAALYGSAATLSPSSAGTSGNSSSSAQSAA